MAMAIKALYPLKKPLNEMFVKAVVAVSNIGMAVKYPATARSCGRP